MNFFYSSPPESIVVVVVFMMTIRRRGRRRMMLVAIAVAVPPSIGAGTHGLWIGCFLCRLRKVPAKGAALLHMGAVVKRDTDRVCQGLLFRNRLGRKADIAMSIDGSLQKSCSRIPSADRGINLSIRHLLGELGEVPPDM